MNKWMSVKDRLPEESGQYLVYVITPDGSGGFTEGCKILTFFTGEIAWVCKKSIVTYWMPLPKPPEEE